MPASPARKPDPRRDPASDLRTVIDHLPATVSYWDRELRNVVANAQYAEWFGLAPEQITGRHVRDVLGETVYAVGHRHMQAALGGEVQRFDAEFVDAQGVTRQTQSCYVPHIVDGEVRGFVVLATDVSARVAVERALADSAERYRALVRSIPGGFVLAFDHEMRFSVADGDALEMFGYTRQALEGRTLREALEPELAGELEPRYRDALRGRTRAWDRVRGDRVYRLTAGPVRDDAGRILGGTVVCHDVTAERRSEAATGALHAIAALIAASAPLAQILTEVAEQLRRVFLLERAGVARFLDGERFEYVALSPPVSGPALAGSVRDERVAVAEVARTGQAAVVHYDLGGAGVTSDLVIRGHRAGAAVPIVVGAELWGAVGLATADPRLLDADMLRRLAGFGELIAVAVANAQAWASLTRQAVTDPLTGLGNRRAFYDTLGREVQWARRHGRELSMVLMDIDHFKAINDRHGHQAGDRVLVQLARCLTAQTRASEMVGRIGGEEFAWVLPEAGGEAAVHVAERVRESIADTEFDGVGRVTVSLGVATLSQCRHTDELIRAADQALYAAKAAGRNVTRRYGDA